MPQQLCKEEQNQQNGEGLHWVINYKNVYIIYLFIFMATSVPTTTSQL